MLYRVAMAELLAATKQLAVAAHAAGAIAREMDEEDEDDPSAQGTVLAARTVLGGVVLEFPFFAEIFPDRHPSVAVAEDGRIPE